MAHGSWVLVWRPGYHPDVYMLSQFFGKRQGPQGKINRGNRKRFTTPKLACMKSSLHVRFTSFKKCTCLMHFGPFVFPASLSFFDIVVKYLFSGSLIYMYNVMFLYIYCHCGARKQSPRLEAYKWCIYV